MTWALKLEVGALYLTPSGRRCFWRPGRPSDEPQAELVFEYLGGGESFSMAPLTVQRLLRRAGPVQAPERPR